MKRGLVSLVSDLSWATKTDLIRGRGWLGLWSFVTWLFTIAGLFCIMGFLFAKTPAAANTYEVTIMPADWPAGVGNGNAFYLWWTIGGNPLLFLVSVAAFLNGPLTIVRVHRKRARLQGEQAPPHPAVKAFMLGMLLLGIALVAALFLQFCVGVDLIDWPTVVFSGSNLE